MGHKLQIYARCGVEEYYIYDPDRFILKGYQRSEDFYLERIENMDGWISPRVDICFNLIENELQLTHPTCIYLGESCFGKGFSLRIFLGVVIRCYYAHIYRFRIRRIRQRKVLDKH